jgi:hypothetical protein
MKSMTDRSKLLATATASLFLLALLITTLLCTTTVQASDLRGFVEGAGSIKLGDERAEKNSYNLGETRVQLKYAFFPKLTEAYDGELSLKGELLLDVYREELSSEIRDFNLFISPAPSVDMKIGRQILTWGTGDLLFINDLFPKDYVSFFTGRATEYLKRPSDALRAWYYHDSVSLDLVVIPRIQANRSIQGKRLSFYDGLAGSIEGTESTRTFVTPKKTIKNSEVALRAYKTIKSYEAALYLFKGFYKEPRMILDSAAELFTYPRLRVYGASLRGPMAGGIANMEVGYYDSRDDTGGTDSSTENSSIKYLFGFTRDLAFRDDLKLGVQYMVESMLDYGQYKANLSVDAKARDENRHLWTLRLTQLLRAQTIDANIFLFYSPTDRDLYLRPSIGYKATDAVKLTLGANLFSGNKDYTQFGSLEGNNNLYLRARYSF